MIRRKGIPHDSAPVPISFPEEKQSGTIHTFQFAVRNSDGAIEVPSAGSVTVKIRSPGGGVFEDVPNNQINLLDRSLWIMPLYPVHIEAVELTLSGLDSGSTLDVAISSSFGGAS